MTLQLVEPVIEALVARITGELPAAVDLVNSESDGEVTIDTTDLQVLDYIPTPSELNHFPTVGISEGPGGFQDDIGSGATGVYELNIMIFCMDPDQRRLSTQLRRLRRAVSICALRGRQFGPAWGVVLLGFTPGPTLGRGEHPREWLSYTTITLRCMSEEDEF